MSSDNVNVNITSSSNPTSKYPLRLHYDSDQPVSMPLRDGSDLLVDRPVASKLLGVQVWVERVPRYDGVTEEHTVLYGAKTPRKVAWLALTHYGRRVPDQIGYLDGDFHNCTVDNLTDADSLTAGGIGRARARGQDWLHQDRQAVLSEHLRIQLTQREAMIEKLRTEMDKLRDQIDGLQAQNRVLMQHQPPWVNTFGWVSTAGHPGVLTWRHEYGILPVQYQVAFEHQGQKIDGGWYDDDQQAKEAAEALFAVLGIDGRPNS